MSALYVLSVWAHILAAAVWIGSMAFFAIAVVPVLRRAENRDALAPMVRAIGRRFRVVGWVCVGVAGLAEGAAGRGATRKRASWLGRAILALSVGVLLLAVALVRGAPW